MVAAAAVGKSVDGGVLVLLHRCFGGGELVRNDVQLLAREGVDVEAAEDLVQGEVATEKGRLPLRCSGASCSGDRLGRRGTLGRGSRRCRGRRRGMPEVSRVLLWLQLRAVEVCNCVYLV